MDSYFALVKSLLSLVQQQNYIYYNIAFLLLPILALVISLWLCNWVYRDAQRHGMNGLLWVAIVLVGNIIGLLIYYGVRDGLTKHYSSPYTTSSVCKYCENPLSCDARFCSKCGKEQT